MCVKCFEILGCEVLRTEGESSSCRVNLGFGLAINGRAEELPVYQKTFSGFD